MILSLKLSIYLLIMLISSPICLHAEPLSLKFPQNAIIKSGMLWTQPEKQYKLIIKGGQPPYRWQCLRGDISIDPQQKNIYYYKVPKRFGNDNICIIDGANNRTDFPVKIFRPIKITPSKLFIPVNGEAKARVIGGSGKWEIVDKNEILTISKKNDFITVAAGSEKIDCELSCHDLITGDHSQLIIKIYDKLKLKNSTF